MFQNKRFISNQIWFHYRFRTNWCQSSKLPIPSAMNVSMIASSISNFRDHNFHHQLDQRQQQQIAWIKRYLYHDSIVYNSVYDKDNNNNSSSSSSPDNNTMDEAKYEQLADDTLEFLYDRLEAYIDGLNNLNSFDIVLNNGVITLNLCEYGVYVINKQTPNRQIWLSSPLSGPKRYDYINGTWQYRHDGKLLNELLKQELESLFRAEIDL